MKPSHFLPPSPKRDAAADADDDDEGDAWAVALHRSATAHPSPSRTLHEKLSSPHRKPPSPAETRKRAEERQVAAMRNRGRLRCEQSARLREAAAHARGVRVAKELAVAAREAESARRHDRAEARHAAHLESVRKKAVRESNKVDEISFINEMGLLDMQFDLKRRLNEMEARIDEARARRARLLAGVSSKQQAREKDKEDKLASVGGVRERFECLQWGSASRVTLLRRLLQLPFKYFSRPRHVDVLFPTLVAGCLGNDVNAAVAADDISMRAVADYLKAQLAKRDDAPESVALRGRIPEPLWDRAAAYFDRLSNTATLD
ncbi:hypothetical protein JL722_4676 [Aureococcus anophagefferens]|nr:hypothetical protein JL722_4676 [Aureococcus anophagefferens]